MPFPESQRVIYAKNPLVNVICQLRFPPILRIDTEVPSLFQDFIKNDYPFYKELTEFQTEVSSGVQQPLNEFLINQATKASFTKNHEFSSEDGNWKINLTRTFLSISSTNYQTWENFLEQFTKARKALLEIYAPPFFTRIGIRYIDIIDRSKLGLESIEWKELLQPYFLGLLSSEVSESIQNCENSFEIGLRDGVSIARIVTSFATNVSSNERCYQIDSDFYTPRKTSVPETDSTLNFLHERASRLIRWVITEKLHSAMEPKEIPG